jgi:ferrous-iron efflux pump FieF
MMQENLSYRPDYALWAGRASVATAIVLIAVKTAAFWHSGLTSVLASLTDSLADAVMSAINFLAILYSLKPADEDHRFGHGKIEGLMALLQAALISFAGLMLVWEAVWRFLHPHGALAAGGFAVGVMLFSAALSALLVAGQSFVLKKAPSLAVRSDRAHYTADVVINLGVVLVIAVLHAGGPAWADPVFAGAVAVYMGFSVFSIARGGVDMLLDRELPTETRDAIVVRVEKFDGVLGIHDLRTYRSGMRTFISFDIEVDPSILVWHAHEIVRAVEMDLLRAFPDAEILIHVDPHGDTEDTRHIVRGVHHQ